MRVCLIGDSHGNLGFLAEALQLAAADRRQWGEEIVAISLGDFGFAPGDEGRAFIRGVEQLVEQTGIPLWVVDGNHDYAGAPNNPAGYRFWSDPKPDPGVVGLRHLPRGTRLELDGISVGVCGGAVSVDRFRRIEGHSWWEDETLTDADVARALATAPVEVMLTHDSPWRPSNGSVFDLQDQPQILAVLADHRRRLKAVIAHWHPKVLVHGHWHRRHTMMRDTLDRPQRVIGLAQERVDTGVLITDLGALANSFSDEFGHPQLIAGG